MALDPSYKELRPEECGTCSFRALFDLAAVGNAEIEPRSGRLLRVNRKLCDFTGYSEAELLSKTFLDLTHPDDRAATIALADEVMAGGATEWQLEKRYVRKDGSVRWAHCIGRLIRDEQGRPLHLIATIQDITERKQGEEALRDSEARYRRLVEMSPDVIFVHRNDRMLYANPACVRFFGARSIEEVLTRAPLDFVHPDHREAVRERIRRASTSSAPNPLSEQKWLALDGSVRMVEVVGASIPWEGRPAVMVIAHDITELRAADRRKDEFLATLAHELRNPLAPIRTGAEIVRLHSGGSARLDWAADLISRQVKHLSHMVDDLLDFSRIAQGRLSLTLEQVDLRDIVWQAVEINRAALDAKGHDLTVEVPERSFFLRGDVPRLVQVVSNLFSNAIKFSPARSRIHVAATREDGKVLLRVRDTGAGIKRELLPHIFDLFVQGERTLERAEGGLGIGLALVKAIVALHGGEVAARSDGPGKGSEFVVRLPLLSPSGIGQPERQPEPSHGPSRNPRRVLLVDDNRDAIESLGYLLERLGHEVRSATDGHEALALARAFQPEVAILDLGLPGLNGYALAEEFRRDAMLASVVLVALTGYGQEVDRQKSRAAGFDLHLLKPIALNDLAPILEGTTPREGRRT
ncbi:histidine kinase [Sulfurifustis variabilis]|uniref:histidine kinase n=1 Tax=Sulfurifustis variabilis TaxID=1675686 RepID=A0A1C7AEV3_9GAMM|nr:PAS domain S-box protein [Sulfurifustis variabilis]BAU49706.1 histidine kinase [Sulfurifustis variabilis]